MDASSGKHEPNDNESNRKRQNPDLQVSCKSEDCKRQKIETFEKKEESSNTAMMKAITSKETKETEDKIKLRAIRDFDPKQMNLREKEELNVISKRIRVAEQRSMLDQNERHRHRFKKFDMRKHGEIEYDKEVSDYMKDIGLSRQDEQINSEDALRELKVKVYDRRQETSDIEDQEEANKTDQMKTVNGRKEFITDQNDKKEMNPHEAESDCDSEIESEWDCHMSTFTFEQLHWLPSFDFVSACHDSDESNSEYIADRYTVPLPYKRGDKLETILFEYNFIMSDIDGWLLARQLDSGKIGLIQRNHVVMETDYQPSRTRLYDLPLEMLDIILQESYLHWILNLSTKQRDEEVIRSLISVDVCFYQRITRHRFKKTIWRHLKALIKIKVQTRGAKCTRSMETELLHQKIEDLRNRTKPWSHQTDKLVSQLREEGIEILNSHLNRQTVVVWVWCHLQEALEHIQRLYESNQLRDVFFEYMQPSISKVINIDGNQFKKTIVVCPISINFTRRIEIGGNESVNGVTKLRNEIYVLCRSQSSSSYFSSYSSSYLSSYFSSYSSSYFSPYSSSYYSSSSGPVIRVFEDRISFRLQKTIEVKEIKDPRDIGSSEKENCLYVSDYVETCVWKITKETDGQHKIIKWLTTYYQPYTLSVSSDGQLLVVNQSSSILRIYGSDAELVRSIQLPRSISLVDHAVETSIGNFIILHKWIEEVKGESGSSGRERVRKWVVSELTRDAQMVVRRFIPSNETQQLNNPRYLSLDSDDQVFVADYGNDRVILLDSDLKWNRILCPTKEETEETKILRPMRLCYDEEKKQLIVGGFYKEVNVYTLSRN